MLAQSVVDWNYKTDSLYRTIINSHTIDSSSLEVFKKILKKRGDYRFEERFDTSRANHVRVKEFFHTKTNTFGLKEVHIYPSRYGDLEVTFSPDLQYLTMSYADSNENFLKWRYAVVDSVKPKDFFWLKGCIFRKNDMIKVKRWQKKIDRMPPATESYYVIDTFIDRVHEEIRISFRQPVAKKRKLFVIYGPVGKSRKPFLDNEYRRLSELVDLL